jgi:hypothetical protein
MCSYDSFDYRHSLVQQETAIGEIAVDTREERREDQANDGSNYGSDDKPDRFRLMSY